MEFCVPVSHIGRIYVEASNKEEAAIKAVEAYKDMIEWDEDMLYGTPIAMVDR